MIVAPDPTAVRLPSPGTGPGRDGAAGEGSDTTDSFARHMTQREGHEPRPPRPPEPHPTRSQQPPPPTQGADLQEARTPDAHQPAQQLPPRDPPAQTLPVPDLPLWTLPAQALPPQRLPAQLLPEQPETSANHAIDAADATARGAGSGILRAAMQQDAPAAPLTASPLVPAALLVTAGTSPPTWHTPLRASTALASRPDLDSSSSAARTGGDGVVPAGVPQGDVAAPMPSRSGPARAAAWPSDIAAPLPDPKGLPEPHPERPRDLRLHADRGLPDPTGASPALAGRLAYRAEGERPDDAVLPRAPAVPAAGDRPAATAGDAPPQARPQATDPPVAGRAGPDQQPKARQHPDATSTAPAAASSGWDGVPDVARPVVAPDDARPQTARQRADHVAQEDPHAAAHAGALPGMSRPAPAADASEHRHTAALSAAAPTRPPRERLPADPFSQSGPLPASGTDPLPGKGLPRADRPASDARHDPATAPQAPGTTTAVASASPARASPRGALETPPTGQHPGTEPPTAPDAPASRPSPADTPPASAVIPQGASVRQPPGPTGADRRIAPQAAATPAPDGTRPPPGGDTADDAAVPPAIRSASAQPSSPPTASDVLAARWALQRQAGAGAGTGAPPLHRSLADPIPVELAPHANPDGAAVTPPSGPATTPTARSDVAALPAFASSGPQPAGPDPRAAGVQPPDRQQDGPMAAPDPTRREVATPLVASPASSRAQQLRERVAPSGERAAARASGPAFPAGAQRTGTEPAAPAPAASPSHGPPVASPPVALGGMLLAQAVPGADPVEEAVPPRRDDGAMAPPGAMTAPAIAATSAAPLPGSAGSPQVVAPQLAVAARHLSDGPVEVSLSPSELGRVTLTLIQSDGSIVVAVTAERAETLDLLRRSIGLLAQELQDLGYANPGFTFGEQRRPTAGTPPDAREPDEPRVDPPRPRDHAAILPAAGASGLNLRL